MRLFIALSLVFLVLSKQASLAQEQCLVEGSAFADGASYCLSAVRDGKVRRALFTCKNGAWTDANALCPDQFAYFCRVGPHAVAVGERLLLGSGPAVLECKFPGILSITQGPSESNGSPAPLPSQTVRDVQRFLSSEDAGINCAVDQCVGQLDDKTILAVAVHVRRNFTRLTNDERAAWGATRPEDVETLILGRSPIDVIPLFVSIFDVPKAN